jgi:uncharacterized membrane protein
MLVEEMMRFAHQVDGDDEVMLLVSLPLLCLLAALDGRRFRLCLHLPLLSCRWLLCWFLRCFCLSTLLASNWSLLACLPLLVYVTTTVCGLVAGLKQDDGDCLGHVFVTRES